MKAKAADILTDRDKQIAALQARVRELEAKQQAWRVLIAELCGHSISDPLLPIVDPVELVRRKLDRYESALAGLPVVEGEIRVAANPDWPDDWEVCTYDDDSTPNPAIAIFPRNKQAAEVFAALLTLARQVSR